MKNVRKLQSKLTTDSTGTRSTLPVRTLRFVSLEDFRRDLRGCVQDIVEALYDVAEEGTVEDSFVDADTVQALCIDPELGTAHGEQSHTLEVIAMLRENDCRLTLLPL